MIGLPQDNIIEVSLIGTGGGYGESIVIHLGYQNWIVIDSCIDPHSKLCLPKKYLEDKGVNLNKDVRLILCTHWHDDHIKGISELLRSCESAKFSMSIAHDRKKFLQLVGLDYKKLNDEESISSTIEIYRCLEIVASRKENIKQAVQDKLLLEDEQGLLKFSIYALSPSDFVLDEFNKEISTLITDYGNINKKIIIQSPNDKSVALLITINNHIILLGSDLEVSEDNRKGWLSVLDNCQCIGSKKATLFKIPHHGSKNGYHKRVWEEIVETNAIAKMTPWNYGNRLPKEEMLKILSEHTDKLYITSRINTSRKPKKREQGISKVIKGLNDTLSEIKYSFGVVRCRLDAFKNDDNWEINLFGEATEFNEKLFKEKKKK